MLRTLRPQHLTLNPWIKELVVTFDGGELLASCLKPILSFGDTAKSGTPQALFGVKTELLSRNIHQVTMTRKTYDVIYPCYENLL